ncbi:MAG: hypothetical protein JXQ91_07545 [Vannielia sp.]|uniref:hypothetical protein n=1 Tax=Vannielia sp. TaxID=2813045 RepID=UPI003B8DC321
MSKQPTVQEHEANCKQVAAVIKDANVLLTKAKAELEYSRHVLEMLLPYQHDLHSIKTSYTSWLTDRDALTPANLIGAQVKRINGLLGDRA